MSDDTPTAAVDDAAERSLVADVRQLVDDGRTLLEAEVAYHKSRALVASQAAKGVAAWGVLALALVFFALMALVLGLVLVLAPVLGPMGATAAVFAGLLAMGAVSGGVAVRRWRRAASHLSDRGRD